MKKLVALILAPLLILGVCATPAIAASPKAGKKCSVFGQSIVSSGKKFTCLMVGTKQLWNKGVKVSEKTTSSAIMSTIQPHPVSGNYGITWSNITSRIKDISVAAWTDAQNTLIRNQNIPDIYKGFVSYISPGALSTDPQIGNAATLLKRELVLYANLPRAKNVYIIATTQEEQLVTQAEIEKLYPDALGPLVRSLNSIYGIEETGGSAAGAPWIHPKCNGADGLRNAFSQPTRSTPSIATAVMAISICPTSADQELEGVHGVAHEYIHTIQVALHPGGNIHEYQPCWMTEGETEWSQAVVSNDFDTYLSRTHYHPYYLTQSGLNYHESTQLVWSAKDVESYLKGAANPRTCGDTDQYALAYSLGAATVEALVSLAGSESVLALDQRLSQRQSMNTAFKEIYGITWDSAIPILSQVVAEKISKAMSTEALTFQTRP